MVSSYEGTRRTWQSLPREEGRGLGEGGRWGAESRGFEELTVTAEGLGRGYLFRWILCFYSIPLGRTRPPLRRTSYIEGFGKGLSFQG